MLLIRIIRKMHKKFNNIIFSDLLTIAKTVETELKLEKRKIISDILYMVFKSIII